MFAWAARQWGPIVPNNLIRLELHNQKSLYAVSYGFIITISLQSSHCKTRKFKKIAVKQHAHVKTLHGTI